LKLKIKIKMKRIENKKVKDVMTYGVVSIPEDSSVMDVARIFVEANVHGVVVMSNRNEPLGVISELDLPKAFGKDFRQVNVKEIYNTPISTVNMDESIKKAGEIMKEKHIHRLIVVDENNRIRGVLSISDIIKDVYKIYSEKCSEK